MKRQYLLIWLAAFATIAAGCSNIAPSPLNYSQTRIESCSRDRAFDAARQALGERFRVAKSNPESGVIIAEPLESEGPVPGARLGDLMQTDRRTRTRARAIVTGAEQNAEVWCKIVVDRYEGQGSTLFAHDAQRLDDATGTPVDRGSARTDEQNAVWRTVGRDKEQERSILRAVVEITDRSRPVTTP